jgi:oligosaccharyltransferase complex subunit beta
MRNVIAWNFGLSGILRVGEISARRSNSTEEISEIRIKDYLDYSIEIYEYVHSKNTWAPFVASDLSLEFIMLDPYIRTLLNKASDAKYSASF